MNLAALAPVLTVMHRFTLLLLLLLAPVLFAQNFTPTEDGLYAIFTVTINESEPQTFVARLFFEETPVTVANFVRLAEGGQPIPREDRPGVSTDPLFRDLVVYRKINDFVFQLGSPNGTNSYDSGYTIPDEIWPEFSHDKTGMLSMANTGQPNTGSVQFFVTLGENDPRLLNLDGQHTIFGEVIEGLDVVNMIEDQPTDNEDRPTVDIIVESIRILAEGATAEAFDAAEFPLPRQADPVETRIVRGEVTEERPQPFDLVTALGFEQSALLYFTTDFTEFTRLRSIQEYSALPGENLVLTADGLFTNRDRAFVQSVALTNPGVEDRAGMTLTVNVDRLPDPFVTRLQAGLSREPFIDDPVFYQAKFDYAAEEIVDGDAFYRWYPLGERAQVYIFYPLGEERAFILQLFLTFETESSGPLNGRFRFVDIGEPNFEGSFTLEETPAD